MDSRSRARQLARDFLARGDHVGWFDELYTSAKGDDAQIPWADMRLNPNVAEWLNRREIDGAGQSAVVVGCGLGDDAEELAPRGFDVVAFDISPAAIAWCRRRFPSSSVDYVVADLLSNCGEWNGKFDFVLESYTLQVLPAELRQTAMSQMASFVRQGGTLLVVTRGRSDGDDPGSMPWPITRRELSGFERMGLECAAFEDYFEQEATPVRRFRGIQAMLIGIGRAAAYDSVQGPIPQMKVAT